MYLFIHTRHSRYHRSFMCTGFTLQCCHIVGLLPFLGLCFMFQSLRQNYDCPWRVVGMDSLLYDLRRVLPIVACGGRRDSYLRIIGFEFEARICISVAQFWFVFIMFRIST
jgi:hypothetical protein